MNFFDPVEIKNYLLSQGLKPRHYMGQNFLIDKDALDEVVGAGEIKKTDTILEVGPGLGVLTAELIARAGKVIAVEKDPWLFKILKKSFRLEDSDSSPWNKGRMGGVSGQSISLTPPTPSYSKRGLQDTLTLINQDILKFNISEHIKGPYKVIANIPYYLTSHLIQYFLNQQKKPALMVLMIQKEVGERVVASPGELSVLGISVQVFADAEVVASVPKNSFWPVPKVDSVILRITPAQKYPEINDWKLFFRIVKTAFAGKRKQIHNTLSGGLAIPKDKLLALFEKAGIDPSKRPQDLSIEDWKRLYLVIA